MKHDITVFILVTSNLVPTTPPSPFGTPPKCWFQCNRRTPQMLKMRTPQMPPPSAHTPQMLISVQSLLLLFCNWKLIVTDLSPVLFPQFFLCYFAIHRDSLGYVQYSDNWSSFAWLGARWGNRNRKVTRSAKDRKRHHIFSVTRGKNRTGGRRQRPHAGNGSGRPALFHSQPRLWYEASTSAFLHRANRSGWFTSALHLLLWFEIAMRPDCPQLCLHEWWQTVSKRSFHWRQKGGLGTPWISKFGVFRTVARNYSVGVLCVCAKVFTIKKLDKNSTSV